MIAITALFISLAVAIVTVLQWRVADNKLRLDLFERRYKVYEATQTLVRVSVQDSARVQEYVSVFDDETASAEFLFDADVVDYLRQIRKLALDKDLLPLGDQSKSTEITNIFARYLQFANIKSRFIPSFMNEKRVAKEWLYLVAWALFGLLAMPFILFVLGKLFTTSPETLPDVLGGFYAILVGKPSDALILWLIVAVPYLLFQFIRSVIWAWKTSRSA